MSLVSKRISSYVITFVVLLAISVALLNGFIPITVHTSLMHSTVQSIATLISFFIGSSALYIYYHNQVKSNVLLFIGVGFLGTSVIDLFHTVVTAHWFIEEFKSMPPTVPRWSWVATRIILAVLLFLSLFDKLRVNEKIVYITVSLVTIASVILFFIVPLPFPMYPNDFISRPMELIPGFIFLIALIGYLIKGTWRTDTLVHYVVLCLIASTLCQFAYIAESKTLFDSMYIAAHYVKIFSYAMIYLGITSLEEK